MPSHERLQQLLTFSGAILLSYVVVKLAPLLLLVALATLIAVTLHPLVRRLHEWGLRRGLALTVAVVALLSSVAIAALVIVPPLSAQIMTLAKDLPQLQHQLSQHLLHHSVLGTWLDRLWQSPLLPDVSAVTPHLLAAGQFAMSGLSELVIVLVMAIYLLIEGSKTSAWLIAFFHREKRDKIRSTARELSAIISAYVVGQVVTSLLVFAFSYAVLLSFKVPAALTLAILAGFMDVLPLLGFFLAAIPAFLVALSVSPAAGLSVGLLYVGYHLLENYVIVPWVYGSKLRLSTLAVLLGLLAGALLGGISGAVLVLPVIASYGVIERIWLVDVLGETVVRKHAEQSQTEEQKPPLL